jgi:hypothetical protein
LRKHRGQKERGWQGVTKERGNITLFDEEDCQEFTGVGKLVRNKWKV